MMGAKLAAALAKAQGAMKNAEMNKTNPHYRSRYADLAAIRDAVVPALSANGIALVQTIEPVEAGFIVRTTLLHDEDALSSTCPILCAPNAPAQAFGSALTYARRYSLAAIAGIAADEDDDGNEAQANAPKSQSKPTQKPQAPAPQTPAQKPAGYAIPHGSTDEFLAKFERWIARAKPTETATATDILHGIMRDNDKTLKALTDEQYNSCVNLYQSRLAEVSAEHPYE